MQLNRQFLSRVLSFLAGPFGYLLVFATVATYVVLALFPFNWSPPRRIENHARLDGDDIQISDVGIAYVNSTSDWIEKAIERNQFTMRVGFTPSSTEQTGPARIVTVSVNPYLRNVTVAQEGPTIIIRLRTTKSTLNGLPEFEVPELLRAGQRYEIELVVDRNVLQVMLDGEAVGSRQLPVNPLANWDRSFEVTLGNERTGNRPWLGSIDRAEIQVGDQLVDLLDRRYLDVPSKFWIRALDIRIAAGSQFIELEFLLDSILNIVCFSFLSFVIMALRPNRQSALFVIAACSLLSLTVELSQILFDDRWPSLTDWILNTLGAGIGTICYRAAAAAQSFTPISR